MNNKQYKTVIDLINVILKFLIAYTLISILIIATLKSTDYVYQALWLIPASFISYFTGKYSKHIWTFLFSHVLLFVIYIFISTNAFITVYYTLFLTVLTILELKNRLKPEIVAKSNTSLLFISILLVMNILCYYLSYDKLNQLFFSLTFLYVLLYLLNMYLLNFERFFQNQENLSNVPIQKIRGTNNLLILFFGSFCFFVMLLFTNFPLKVILTSIGSFLLSILRFFISLFTSLFKHNSVQKEVLEEPVITPESPLPSYSESTSNLLEIIQNIILTLLTIAIIGAAIALLVFLLYKLYQHFYENKTNHFKDKTEFISPFDKKEDIPKESNKTSIFSRLTWLFGRTNNEQIRKSYYKAIKSHAESEQLTSNLTPSELSQFAFSSNSGLLSNNNIDHEKLNQLTLLYEKARYSKEECSKDEVVIVKQILK
jgi:hypothetical protein